MSCPVCKFRKAGSAELFALGFISGANVVAVGHMPALCAAHQKTLSLVAEANGINLFASASKEEHESKRDALLLAGAVRLTTASGVKS